MGLLGSGLALGLVVIGLSGCADSSSPAGGPPAGTTSWLGATAEQVEQRLGPPNARGVRPSGDTVLLYRWSRTDTVGGYTAAGGSLYTGSSLAMGRQYVPMQRLNMYCQVAFTVGPDDKVKNVDLEGNACFDEAR